MFRLAAQHDKEKQHDKREFQRDKEKQHDKGSFDQWDKKDSNEARKDKHVKAKSNTIRKRAMRQAEKLKDDKKATMTQGINLALLCFCLFLKKRFNRHESGSKNDITIRL